VSETLGEWRALWRDSIGLRRVDGGSPVAASVAGRPSLPADAEWPLDGDGNPKQYLMAYDLAALPRIGIDLPDRGVLQFYIDTEYEDPTVLYFEDTTGLQLRDAPVDEGWDRIDLMAVAEPTWPGEDHPYLSGRPKDHYKAIRKALMDFDHPATPGQGDHRIGGYYAVSAQGEFPCAPTSQVPDLPGTPDAAAFGLPILLARMDYDPDAGMPWGDCGTSEWTIGREDLAARRFDRVEFSWSCY
jgi:hypothetical protein